MAVLGPVFEPGESLSSPRLTLSRLGATHMEVMCSWLPAALAPDWRLVDLDCWVDSGAGVLISDEKGEAIGVAVVRLDAPRAGAASLPFLAIEPSRRFCGLGGEAGIALERWLRESHDVGEAFAPIPDWRGLAVYFWLRLGYRPLTLSESPGPLIGLADEPRQGMWMARREA